MPWAELLRPFRAGTKMRNIKVACVLINLFLRVSLAPEGVLQRGQALGDGCCGVFVPLEFE
jgi:hypothetical protein